MQPPFEWKSPFSYHLSIFFLLFAVIICSCDAGVYFQNAKILLQFQRNNRLAFVPPPSARVIATRKIVADRLSVAQTNNNNNNNNNNHLEDEESTVSSPSPANYKSRSTATPDASSKFYIGMDERRERLHQALQEIGLNPTTDLIDLPEYKGSAALRTYSSFLLPKSEGALAMTNQPQRAAVVANNIAFLMREHRSHQEEWLRNHDRSLKEAEELLLLLPDQNGQQQHKQRNPITLVLDGIRSAHNVGNILRAAEAAKCREVMLCGSMTPAPPNPKVLKTALGAAEYVPYRTVGSTFEAVQALKRDNVKVIGVETTSRSIPLWKTSFFDEPTSPSSSTITTKDDGEREEMQQQPQPQQIAFVFGNELVGVDITVLEECDELVAVPTHGIKNSLNVAACASVLIWEALRQLDSMQNNES